jgi:hypothetical protein
VFDLSKLSKSHILYMSEVLSIFKINLKSIKQCNRLFPCENTHQIPSMDIDWIFYQLFFKSCVSNEKKNCFVDSTEN